MLISIVQSVKCFITILRDTCGLSVRERGTKWPTAMDIRLTLNAWFQTDLVLVLFALL